MGKKRDQRSKRHERALRGTHLVKLSHDQQESILIRNASPESVA
jgi:hypothetical protein